MKLTAFTLSILTGTTPSISRWPKTTLAGTRWLVRIGALCQLGYGVPAVTISMLLLEGNISELLAAVAQYRPDLLHHSNRERRFTA